MGPHWCPGVEKGESSLFFFTLDTGPRRSLRLKLSDTRVYAPQIRARLGTTAHFCQGGTDLVGAHGLGDEAERGVIVGGGGGRFIEVLLQVHARPR